MALQRSSALERFEEQQRLAAQEWEQKEMGLMEKRRLALVLRTLNLTRARTLALGSEALPHQASHHSHSSGSERMGTWQACGVGAR